MASPAKQKRSKVCQSFKTKMEIIRRLATGESASSLSRTYGVNESSIRTIARNAERIKASVMCSPEVAAFTSRVRNPLVVRMEAILIDWIQTLDPKSVSFPKVRPKALSIYRELKAGAPPDSYEPFAASKGWYYKFCQRLSKTKSEYAREDPLTTCVQWEDLKAAIETNGYMPQQIFAANDIRLLWKRMPSRAYNQNRMDATFTLNSAKEMFKVLLCNSIDGTYKCKPLLVSRSDLPIPAKVASKSPAHLKQNRTGNVTSKMFEQWFINCFCPELEEHCNNNELEFKGLLLLNNSPGYPTQLCKLHPTVKIMFLPIDVTEILKPLQQDIENIFKMNYAKLMFRKIAKKVEKYGERAPNQFLSELNIQKGVKYAVQAWNELDISTANESWQSLCEGYASTSPPSDSTTTMMEVLKYGRMIPGEGFEDMEESDIVHLLEIPCDLPMEEVASEEIEVNVDLDFTKADVDVEKVNNLMRLVQQVASQAVDIDPNLERSTEFVKSIRSAVSVYRNIIKKKQKQCTKT